MSESFQICLFRLTISFEHTTSIKKIKMPNLTAEEVDQKIAAAVADWDEQLDTLVEEKVDEKIAAAIEEKIEAAIQEERKAVYHNMSMIKTNPLPFWGHDPPRTGESRQACEQYSCAHGPQGRGSTVSLCLWGVVFAVAQDSME